MTAQRNILVATLGLAPQVLTETIYAQAMQDDPFVPDKIHVVTTAPGREALIHALLSGPRPRLAELADDYDLQALAQALTPDNIHVVSGDDGHPLDDIDSEQDNLAAADRILRLVRDLTADQGTRLHVSIAGGRKTMGFLLGYALSLFGRPQDQLSHVLVDAPLERHPEFYYPRPVPQRLMDRDGNEFVADASRVSLAEIPFVRLREGLPQTLLSGDKSYSETVGLADQQFQPLTLIVDLKKGQLICHGHSVPVGAAELAFAAMLARRRMAQEDHEGAVHWRDLSVEEYLELYRLTPTPIDRTIEALQSEDGLTSGWFSQQVSRLENAIRRSLGPLAQPYLLQRVGGRPITRRGFEVPIDAIKVIGVPWGGPAS